MNFYPQIRGKYKKSAKIQNWFALDVSAKALFKPADLDDLQTFLREAFPKKIPIIILGACSNTILSETIDGVVIKLGSEFAKISNQKNTIKIGAAALCKTVATYSKINGLSGLEFLTGIPGSIGGAIAMNAGCYDSDISKVLISAKAVDFKGLVVELKNKDFHFSYRKNDLACDFIFVEAEFLTTESTIEEVSKKVDEFNKKREETQPIRAKTGGSTFKNPSNSNKKAWELLDSAGFRGFKIGGAKFSEKHCNFMINDGNAKAKDLIELANKAHNVVKEKFGIDLEMEIKIV
jgi:UDP-N-acetylmuramate dehydrogenase